MRRFLLVISFLASLVSILHSQVEGPVEGRILDQKTKRPLAFVSIVYTSRGQGTVSNIDGEFSITSPSQIEFLKFSYLGYRERIIPKKDIKPGKMIQVRLNEKAYEIEEVQILPGINPAHRIIDLVLENRDRNNPEKMQSFAYNSYSKMYFTLDLDSMYADAPGGENQQSSADSSQAGTDPHQSELNQGQASGDKNLASQENSQTSGDSGAIIMAEGDQEDLEDFLEKNHLFLMEFVSEREFLQPDKNREVVTASRVSGFNDPSFTLIASQIQSFSFYDELILIWDKKYLNPLSRGSTRKYLFVLEDTMYTEQKDSLFLISFKPLRGRNFDGLKGILHINSDAYAVQNVIAEAAETEGVFKFRIQQKYEHIEDEQWFPVQLNTDLMISPKNAETNGKPITLVGIGKSYLSEIRLNPELRKRDFNHIEIEVEDNAHKKDDEFWQQYRVNPLTRKDSNTYHFIDSIGQEAHLDRQLKLFETFASGYIPAGFLNIDYRSLIHWSRYEGLRLGAAVETNDKISPWVQVGGKFAYGFGDKEIKYGGHLKINLNRRKDAFLKISYNKDIVETAGWRFVEKPPINSSEIFRSFLISGMDNIEEKSVELQFPALRYFKINTYLNQGIRQVTNDYRYMVSKPEGDLETGEFNITETGLKLKYAHKEKFLETPRGNRISLGTNYPIIYANLHLGLPMLGGEYEYTKLEGKITKTFVSKSLGDTKIALTGGWADRSLPYPLLYAGAGSYGVFTIESENSFATMRMNEFVSDRFASVHFQQDFGKLLFRKGKFQPGIVLAGSAGYGAMAYDPRHVNLNQTSYEKGYYESGILFNNLLRFSIFGYGLGVFYRMGPYTLPKTIDNFAFKFTIRFIL